MRHSRFAALRARLEEREPREGWRLWLYEFLLFGFKQGWACLFGALLLALLLATHLFYPDDAAIYRYDALTLAAVAIQAAMLALRLETWDEARVILLFHVAGTAMELFKTAAGSWSYPEPALLKLGGVPLFSGFMYASVGSYIARVWRIFDFRFQAYPQLWTTWVLAGAIYLNFFTHHFTADLRLLLFAAAALVFGRTRVHFRNLRVHRWMPLLAGLLLVALFIWLAENVATFANAWDYPGQEHDWRPVSLAKFGSWFLLMIVSFTLVSLVAPIRDLRSSIGIAPAPLRAHPPADVIS